MPAPASTYVTRESACIAGSSTTTVTCVSGHFSRISHDSWLMACKACLDCCWSQEGMIVGMSEREMEKDVGKSHARHN